VRETIHNFCRPNFVLLGIGNPLQPPQPPPKHVPRARDKFVTVFPFLQEFDPLLEVWALEVILDSPGCPETTLREQPLERPLPVIPVTGSVCNLSKDLREGKVLVEVFLQLLCVGTIETEIGTLTDTALIGGFASYVDDELPP